MVFTLSNNVCSICEENEYTISPTDAKKYINFINKSLKAKSSTEKPSNVHLCLFCTYSIEQFRKTASKFNVGCNVTAINCFSCNSRENVVKLSELSTEYRTKITDFSKHYNIQGKHLCVECFYLINFWRKLKSSWKSMCSNTLVNIESEDDSSSKDITSSISKKKNKSQLSNQLKALRTTTFTLRKYKKIQTKFKLNKDDKLLHEIPFVLLQKDIEANLSKTSTPRRNNRSLTKQIESEIKGNKKKGNNVKLPANKRTNAITGKLNNLSINSTNSEDSDNSVSSAPFVKPPVPKSTSKTKNVKRITVKKQAITTSTRKSRRQSDKIIDLSINSSGASSDSSDGEISKRNKRSHKKIDSDSESTSVPSKNTTRDDSDSDLDELPPSKVRKEVIITCQQCDISFDDLFDYEKHILEHKEKKSAAVNIKRFSTSELETISDNKDEDSEVEELVNGSQEDVNSDNEKTKEVEEIIITQDKVLDVNKSTSEVDEIDDLADCKDSETVQNSNSSLEKNGTAAKDNAEKDESNLDDELSEKQKKLNQTVETEESQKEDDLASNKVEKADQELQSNLQKDIENISKNIEQVNTGRLVEICVEEGEDNKPAEAEQDPLENTSSVYEDAIEAPVPTTDETATKKTVDDSATVEKEDSSAVSIVVETDDDETDEIPAKNDNSAIERALHAMDLLSENSDVEKTVAKEISPVREISDDSDAELSNKRGRDGDSSDGEDTPRTKRVRFATEKKVLNEDNSICLMDEEDRVNLDIAEEK